MDFKQLPQYLLWRHAITQQQISSGIACISNALMISNFYYIEFMVLEQIENPLLIPFFIINWNIFTEKNMYKFLLSSIFLSIT